MENVQRVVFDKVRELKTLVRSEFDEDGGISLSFGDVEFRAELMTLLSKLLITDQRFRDHLGIEESDEVKARRLVADLDSLFNTGLFGEVNTDD